MAMCYGAAMSNKVEPGASHNVGTSENGIDTPQCLPSCIWWCTHGHLVILGEPILVMKMTMFLVDNICLVFLFLLIVLLRSFALNGSSFIVLDLMVNRDLQWWTRVSCRHISNTLFLEIWTSVNKKSRCSVRSIIAQFFCVGCLSFSNLGRYFRDDVESGGSFSYVVPQVETIWSWDHVALYFCKAKAPRTARFRPMQTLTEPSAKQLRGTQESYRKVFLERALYPLVLYSWAFNRRGTTRRLF